MTVSNDRRASFANRLFSSVPCLIAAAAVFTGCAMGALAEDPRRDVSGRDATDAAIIVDARSPADLGVRVSDSASTAPDSTAPDDAGPTVQDARTVYDVQQPHDAGPPPDSGPPPSRCPCRGGVDNFCNYPPATADCEMTAARGYCDPNGDGSYADGDWVRGYNEFHAQCGTTGPTDAGTTGPTDAGSSSGGACGLQCANVQWWTSTITHGPYMDYNPGLGHAYWWDTDLSMRGSTPVVLRHDARLIASGVFAWGWQPTFQDVSTGEYFRFLHLRPQPASMFATAVGNVYCAGTVVGLSGGDTYDTGLRSADAGVIYSTGAHLCVQTINAYRTVFPNAMDSCR